MNVDVQMMSTIIRNLISNGIKFTDTGGEVAVSCEACGEDQIIQIKDTGIGMTPDQIESFYGQKNDSKPGTNNEIGSGVGKKLVHMMLEKHKGRLEVESKPGKGTTIRLHIMGS